MRPHPPHSRLPHRMFGESHDFASLSDRTVRPFSTDMRTASPGLALPSRREPSPISQTTWQLPLALSPSEDDVHFSNFAGLSAHRNHSLPHAAPSPSDGSFSAELDQHGYQRRDSGQAFNRHERANFYQLRRSGLDTAHSYPWTNRPATGSRDAHPDVRSWLSPPPSRIPSPPPPPMPASTPLSSTSPYLFSSSDEPIFEPLMVYGIVNGDHSPFIPAWGWESQRYNRSSLVSSSALTPPRVPSPRPTSPFEESFLRSLHDEENEGVFFAEHGHSHLPGHQSSARRGPELWHPFPLSTSAELRRRAPRRASPLYASRRAPSPPRRISPPPPPRRPSPPPEQPMHTWRFHPSSSYIPSNSRRNSVTIPELEAPPPPSRAPRIDLSAYREGPFRASLARFVERERREHERDREREREREQTREPRRSPSPPFIPPLPSNIGSLSMPMVYESPAHEPSRLDQDRPRPLPHPSSARPRPSVALHASLDAQNAIRPREREWDSSRFTPRIHESLTRYASRHAVPPPQPPPRFLGALGTTSAGSGDPLTARGRTARDTSIDTAVARLETLRERAGPRGEGFGQAIAHLRALRQRDGPSSSAANVNSRREARSQLSRDGLEVWRERRTRLASLRRGLSRPLGDYMRDEDFDSSYESLSTLASLLGDVKPRRTSDSVIKSLPKGLYKDWAHGESDTRCPICLDDYVPEDELLKVPLCSHWLHQGCLEQWLRGASTCPVCRGRVDNRSSTQARNPDDSALTSSTSSHLVSQLREAVYGAAADDLPPVGHWYGPSSSGPRAGTSGQRGSRAGVGGSNTSRPATGSSGLGTSTGVQASATAPASASNAATPAVGSNPPPPMLSDVGLDFDIEMDSEDELDDLYF